MEDPVDTTSMRQTALIDVITRPALPLHAALTTSRRTSRRPTVDVEDRHFWTRAPWTWDGSRRPARLSAPHNAGGASTIPEQLAKISFLQDNGSLAYKITEIILGTELVNDFSRTRSWRCT